ncbi:MAG: glycosyltransferase [Cyanobacteria bacterium J06623_4]
MKKIMIYCQHLAGMGHLVRCREIIRALVDDFQVCFVSGGQIVPQFEMPLAVEIVHLPALYQKDAELIPLDDSMSLAQTQTRRKEILMETFDRIQPDCLITECFPFSKLSMKEELKPLLKKAKASIRPVRIVCSLRDLIMTQPMSATARERRVVKVCKLVNRFYDAVLFHSDGHVQQLRDCFPSVDNLNCEVFYTGYVAQSPALDVMPTPADVAGMSDDRPMIIVSAGGGRHGYALLSAAIEASKAAAEQLSHQFHLFAGPFMPEEDFKALQQAATHWPNVTLRRYTCVLLDYLKKADLSISLGGYNTTMNLLRTGVRSLLLPSPNASQADEQRIRAEKLSTLGLLTLLTPEDLSPERLAKAITTALDRPQSGHQINLQGAAHTASYLRKLLSDSHENSYENSHERDRLESKRATYEVAYAMTSDQK